MLPKLYQFTDLSHHKGHIPGQALANLGHRIVIRKGSDNYHMPDLNGKYDFSANRHYDARFVPGVKSDREAGLAWLGYHFARWDRPLPLSDKPGIVQANFDNYIVALYMLVQAGVITEEEFKNLDAGILDAEQSFSQLDDAGLSKNTVSSMLKDMVDKFLERFPKLIFYSGSWWTDARVNNTTMEYIASKTTCWEPEYVSIGGLAENYMPAIDIQYYWENYFKPPHGFSKEFATSADDTIGKIFAWQYTNRGRVPGYDTNIDYNLTALTKGELFKYSGQDGSVDPPPPPPPPPPPEDCTEAAQQAQVALLDGLIDSLSDMRGEILS